MSMIGKLEAIVAIKPSTTRYVLRNKINGLYYRSNGSTTVSHASRATWWDSPGEMAKAIASIDEKYWEMRTITVWVEFEGFEENDASS